MHAYNFNLRLNYSHFTDKNISNHLNFLCLESKFYHSLNDKGFNESHMKCKALLRRYPKNEKPKNEKTNQIKCAHILH